MFYDISSTQNKVYKHIKSLSGKKAREENFQFVIEGIKSVKDAIEANSDIAFLAFSDDFNEELLPIINDIKLYKIPSSIFSPLCDTKTPQGILAVINMPKTKPSISSEDLFIYCDNISDPGNLGTIIRTADAVGIKTVILSNDCVDVYNPKVIRSTMGSFFHVKILFSTTNTLSELKQQGISLVAGVLNEKSVDYLNVDFKNPTAIIIGNEANGVRSEIVDMCDYLVKIPIYGRAESLNAGIAAGVLMYEALRQRTKGNC